MPVNVMGGGDASNSNGGVVFLSQMRSYYYRGERFRSYSQLEFECIVELKVVEKDDHEDLGPPEDLARRRGHPRRQIFPLSPDHPLLAFGYEEFIRMKFLMAMFGGGPPPTYHCPSAGDFQQEHEAEANPNLCLSKYILATFAPWSLRSDDETDSEDKLGGQGPRSF